MAATKPKTQDTRENPLWTDGTTTIVYSSAWRWGHSHQRDERGGHPVTHLMGMLREFVLDRRLATMTYRSDLDGPAAWHGNFLHYSGAFQIETSDPGVQAWIEYAITQNCRRQDWWDQPDAISPWISDLYSDLGKKDAEIRSLRRQLAEAAHA